MSPIRERLNRSLPLVLVLAVTGWLFISPYLHREAKPAKAEKPKGPTAVQVVPATRANLRQPYEAPGIVAGAHEVTVTAQTEGTLRRLSATLGQRVQRGQSLAAIDDRLLRADMAEGGAELVRAQRELALVRELAKRQLADQRRLQAAIAAEASARAALARLETHVAIGTFQSPIAGVITAQEREAGDTVRPGDALFTITDVSRLRVLARVPEEEAAKLKPGDTARIEAEMLGESGLGVRVLRVAPAADPASHMVGVELDAGAAYPRLKPGFRVSVAFVTAQRLGVLTVPRAILPGDPGEGEARVYVVQGDVAHARKLMLGMTDEERVEVLTGLAEGELVVARGAKLKDGAQVKVVGTGAPARLDGR